MRTRTHRPAGGWHPRGSAAHRACVLSRFGTACAGSPRKPHGADSGPGFSRVHLCQPPAQQASRHHSTGERCPVRPRPPFAVTETCTPCSLSDPTPTPRFMSAYCWGSSRGGPEARQVVHVCFTPRPAWPLAPSTLRRTPTRSSTSTARTRCASTSSTRRWCAQVGQARVCVCAGGMVQGWCCTRRYRNRAGGGPLWNHLRARCAAARSDDLAVRCERSWSVVTPIPRPCPALLSFPPLSPARLPRLHRDAALQGGGRVRGGQGRVPALVQRVPLPGAGGLGAEGGVRVGAHVCPLWLPGAGGDMWTVHQCPARRPAAHPEPRLLPTSLQNILRCEHESGARFSPIPPADLAPTNVLDRWASAHVWCGAVAGYQ